VPARRDGDKPTLTCVPDIIDSCPLTKLAGGLSKLHCADDDTVAWLTAYDGPQRMIIIIIIMSTFVKRKIKILRMMHSCTQQPSRHKSNLCSSAHH